MSPILVLLFGALGTYRLRLLFTTLVPARLLPQRLRDTLPFVGPAAQAALVATDLGHAAGSAASIWANTGGSHHLRRDRRGQQVTRAHDHRRTGCQPAGRVLIWAVITGDPAGESNHTQTYQAHSAPTLQYFNQDDKDKWPALAETVRNGVDTTTLFATLDAIKAQPEIAAFQFRAHNKWIDGAHNRSTIKARPLITVTR